MHYALLTASKQHSESNASLLSIPLGYFKYLHRPIHIPEKRDIKYIIFIDRDEICWYSDKCAAMLSTLSVQALTKEDNRLTNQRQSFSRKQSINIDILRKFAT